MRANVTTEKYKRQLYIIPASTYPVSTSVVTVPLRGLNADIWVLTGNVWIDALGRTDLTTSNGLKCTAGTLLPLNVPNNLTLISDGAGGTFQVLIYEE